MRTDFSTLAAMLDGFGTRAPTGDGRAAQRRRADFPGRRPVALEVVLAPEDLDLDVRDLRTTLEGRHSTLHYGELPVPTGLVLGTVRAALQRDREDFDLDDEMGGLEAFVLAFRSSDLEPGVYRVTHADVDHVMPLPPDEQLVDFGVQREFALGAGIVSVAADLDRADSWKGAHGYRTAMVRASSVVYDVNLRLQSYGLVGTVYAGFIPAAVRTRLASDGVARQQMFATTYAQPPDDPVPQVAGETR